ncbi:EAL domain-containing protein [Blastomonas sp.]|uniref:bifunctional diguanylate cyclase/phosphodiesterase n=1 Tax=Blastomonas sp. TaxID=1909299 RepID=UPI002638217E|nr:EAL domain-containing protein [Blastomonas sp.]MDM7955779.1 EAL domain-containing protein [Blastomonas sp.]
MTPNSFAQQAHVVEILADAISAHVCDADSAIDKILSGMGNLSGVDRAYVFQRKACDLLDNTHEWCSQGVAPMIDVLQNMTMDIIAPWREGFERGEPLHVPSIDALDLDPDLRELLAMQGIVGILLVPVQWDGAIMGFVGFDQVKIASPFSSEVLRILIAVAGAVGSILARAAANREIVRTKTELEEAVTQLRHLVMHDDLTGAPNRRAFHLAIKSALECGEQQQTQTSVAMIDLARFKSVNEKYGHTEGDRLLSQIVQRWAVVRTDGVDIYRIGGDEFAVVLNDRNAERAMHKVIEHMRQALIEPFILGDQNTRIDMSAGLTVAPRDGTTADVLAANADLAVLTSKIEKGKTCAYSPDLRKLALQRHETAQDLLAARPDKDFVLTYQPIVDLHSGAIIKVEALLRWQHPTRGLLMPADFIDVLCGLDQSRKVGRWVLDTACRQVAEWNRRFSLDLVVAVNAFPLQVATFDFVLEVHNALHRCKLPVRCLEIEVTENITLQDGSLNLKVLKQLSDMSVAISLDDFGTGFASLNSVLEIDVQTLKIDRSFVLGLHPGDPRIEVLKAMQHMTKGLGIRSVVEGIEDEVVADIVRKIGFDAGQGYYWGRPVDARAFAGLLARERAGALKYG